MDSASIELGIRLQPSPITGYHVGCDPEYRIPRYSLNPLVEVVGLARPEVMAPGNGR